MKTINSLDRDIHKISIPVYANQGSNTIRIKGMGNANTYGLTIDNVGLYAVAFNQYYYQTWVRQYTIAHPGAYFSMSAGNYASGKFGGLEGFANGRVGSIQWDGTSAPTYTAPY